MGNPYIGIKLNFPGLDGIALANTFYGMPMKGFPTELCCNTISHSYILRSVIIFLSSADSKQTNNGLCLFSMQAYNSGFQDHK